MTKPNFENPLEKQIKYDIKEIEKKDIKKMKKSDASKISYKFKQNYFSLK